MQYLDYKRMAQDLLIVHGLVAGAVVRERLEEAGLRGDASAFIRWQNVEATISELRRTGPSITQNR